jgi:glycosyltransferase involved in cell wall biosynthesis
MTTDFLESDYVLKIAGRGAPGYEAELRKLVADLNLTERIQFVGQVEGDEKQKLLADAFWTIMPSHTENFGLVVLESLAQNTPVIASKGSPWEVLETEKLGFWVENSPEELSETLRRIVTMSASEYEDYRKRGRTFVIENFDITRNIQKWADTYRGLS